MNTWMVARARKFSSIARAQKDEADIPEEILDAPPEDTSPDEDVFEESIEETDKEMNEDTNENSDDSLMRLLIRLRKARESDLP